MGIIRGLIEKRAIRFPGVSDMDSFMEWFLGVSQSHSGAQVTESTALNYIAVYACVRILAETIASLPLFTYRRLERGKEKATEHPVYRVLHTQANDEMTALTFREVQVGHLATWGNAYAEIEYDDGGQVRGLWPLRPDRTRPYRNANGDLWYAVKLADGKEVALPRYRVLHVPGFGFDGLTGYSPIRLAKEAIGIGMAAEEFAARFFGNGLNPGMIATHPQKLSQEAQDRLKKSFEEAHSGLSKAWRLMILEEGMQVEKVGIPPEDAQFLESRKFQVTEIARLYRIPPHLLADLDRATFSNIEHQSLEFVMYTLTPWLERLEQTYDTRLFTPEEQQTFFTEHLLTGLLRGDIQSRYSAYAVGRQNGWLSADDIRELENMNPLPDGQGEVYLVPLNMVPAKDIIDGSIDAKLAAPAQPARSRIIVPLEERQHRSALARRRIRRAYARVIEDAAARIIRREKADIMREAEKQLGKRNWQTFDLWLEQFYDQHREFIERNMGPVFRSLAELVQVEVAKEVGGKEGLSPLIESSLRTYLTNYVLYHTHDSLGQIRAVMRQAQEEQRPELEALQQRLAEWEGKRPGKISTWESVALTEAVAVAVYEENQVQRIRWAAIGSSCPWCRRMDGRVVGIKGYFVNKGESVEGEGEGIEPMLVERITRHPPLHLACDCCIAAE